jgi:hypothetical protein
MKIDSLTRNLSVKGKKPLKTEVLDYLEEHSDEVFRYRDEDLARELNAKPSALGFTLWSLESSGLIDKETVGGLVYFGSRIAITKLRTATGQETDWLDMANRNRERIFKRVGYSDNAQLLDDVREGRWD